MSTSLAHDTPLKRILFVDDEKLILNGIRALLRKDRYRWELVFAEGGDAALAEIAKAPFDVVVSDMRMPGMDGAALLEKVKARNPTAIRMVLSGQAEEAAVTRALPVAHQFIAKPCDAQTLRRTLERACELHDTLARDRTGASHVQI
jgi:DNA-binding NtrC family response regulator